ncbi:winged helix-turn-helix domain-containing tetratricopeptide repeat protein [uncultured Cocleimonas sp.]|uniref:winged helix-turn-helix domain-containing tetratricopeptide repeat protein n=1 Tax=uncultured Cocleimonas sp. TaxID=1051587 RepID=UPI002626D797|nr:winged helix-turn-helix domain-containing protein [uncultured Cocleimonas sp.]
MTEHEEQVESSSHLNNECFLVAGWEVSPDTLRIQKGSRSVKLEPKVMQVLVFLANHPGEVISRQELEEDIWRGTIVSYDAITNTVIKLRKAFGDSSKNPSVIETIPKTGYRLIADVQKVISSEPHSNELNHSSKTKVKIINSKKLLYLIVLGGIFIVAVSLFLVKKTTSLLPPDKPSLVVLPFDNVGKNPKLNYFSDGITEDLITDLSNVSGLFVIARNSSFQYKDKPIKLTDIAEKLGVRYILQGSVRRDNNQFRINVQLMDSMTNKNIWAERYDSTLENLFAVQDEVTRKITAALSIRLKNNTGNAVANNETMNKIINVASYDEFLKGWERYWKFTRDDFAIAETHFKKALQLDPDNSRAHAALALIYWKSWQLKWHENHGTPHEGWRRANKEIELALKNPTPLAYSTKSAMLLINRRYEESIVEAEKAIKLNTNYAMAYLALAEALSFSGQPGRAIENAKIGMRLDPNFTHPYLTVIGRSQFDMGLYETSNKSLDCNTTQNIQGCHSLILAIANYGYLGQQDKAQLFIKALNNKSKAEKTPPFTIDRLKYRLPYRRKADRDHFFNGLEKAGVPLW